MATEYRDLLLYPVRTPTGRIAWTTSRSPLPPGRGQTLFLSTRHSSGRQVLFSVEPDTRGARNCLGYLVRHPSTGRYMASTVVPLAAEEHLPFIAACGTRGQSGGLLVRFDTSAVETWLVDSGVGPWLPNDFLCWLPDGNFFGYRTSGYCVSFNPSNGTNNWVVARSGRPTPGGTIWMLSGNMQLRDLENNILNQWSWTISGLGILQDWVADGEGFSNLYIFNGSSNHVQKVKPHPDNPGQLISDNSWGLTLNGSFNRIQAIGDYIVLSGYSRVAVFKKSTGIDRSGGPAEWFAEHPRPLSGPFQDPRNHCRAYGEFLYICGNDGLYKKNIADGSIVWHNPSVTSCSIASVGSNGVPYFGSRSESMVIRCDPSTGDVTHTRVDPNLALVVDILPME